MAREENSSDGIEDMADLYWNFNLRYREKTYRFAPKDNMGITIKGSIH
jgi:hypothetical protein